MTPLWMQQLATHIDHMTYALEDGDIGGAKVILDSMFALLNSLHRPQDSSVVPSWWGAEEAAR